MESKQNTFIAIARGIGKLWMIVTAVIGSCIVVGFIATLLLFKNEKSGPSEKILMDRGHDRIAVIDLTGPIMESDGQASILSQSGSVLAPKILELLDAADKDDTVKAVILRMNTPGGSVVASDEIYQRVLKLRQKKPVVTSMSDMAASGGYYIAAASNEVVANPATLTGSIGVIAELPEFAGLYSKLGVQMRVIKSGQFKDIGSSARDLTPDEQTILQNMINEAYNQFVGSVVNGRHMDDAKVRALADGRVYTGLQAQKNGLIDVLGNFDQAVTEAEKLSKTSNTTVFEYSDQGFLETLFSSKLGMSPLGALSSIVPQQKFGLYYELSL